MLFNHGVRTCHDLAIFPNLAWSYSVLLRGLAWASLPWRDYRDNQMLMYAAVR